MHAEYLTTVTHSDHINVTVRHYNLRWPKRVHRSKEQHLNILLCQLEKEAYRLQRKNNCFIKKQPKSVVLSSSVSKHFVAHP